MDNNEVPYRVWNIINPPSKPMFYPVSTLQEGARLINDLASAQLKDGWIQSNAFGMECVEDGEWSEWYNELGDGILEVADAELED